MSFNGSGTFVINSSGQPVVTNTVISSTAFNALTADLGTGLSTTITKDGQTTTTAKIPFAQGLSAAVASNFAAGTVAAPGLYLSTDTGTGLYRIGANNDGFAVSGAKVLDIASTGLGVTGTLSATGVSSFAAGTVGAPSIYLGADTTTGLYRIGANNDGFAVSGAKVLDISATELGVTGELDVTGTTTLGASTERVQINRLSDFTAYGLVSLNGLDASTTTCGMYGRGSGGDSGKLYITGIGTVVSQIAGVTVTSVSSTGFAITGSLSKSSGTFKIDHPLAALTDTHHLVHSFIEGPQADLIYRGKATLVGGKATVNIDAAASMTEGTFDVLCRDVQCFTTNESDWTPVRGAVAGNILTIESQDPAATSSISWMVIGERKDKHMMETDWTDDNGKVIVEPVKPETK